MTVRITDKKEWEEDGHQKETEEGEEEEEEEEEEGEEGEEEVKEAPLNAPAKATMDHQPKRSISGRIFLTWAHIDVKDLLVSFLLILILLHLANTTKEIFNHSSEI